MKNKAKLILFLGAVLAFVLLAGCSGPSLFAKKTPTATATSTATPTPTITLTPTKTPLPPLALTVCAFLENCPTALEVDELLGYIPDDDDPQTVFVPTNQTLNFSFDWTVLNQATLDETLPFVTWVFTIDGMDYYRSDWLTLKASFLENSLKPNPAAWYSVNVSGWKVGEKHTIAIGLILQKDMSDGWVDLPKGHSYVKVYEVIPVQPPTSTFTLTPTRRPTNTSTPKPTNPPVTRAPSNTPAPACDASFTIHIENNTGGTVTLYMNGPASYKFNLAAGNSTVNVCPGTYSTTAYGCGGSSVNDSFNSSEKDTITYTCY